MTTRSITPDKQKAYALFLRAEESDRSLSKLAGGAEASFLIQNQYEIIHKLCAAIASADGIKVTAQDHHKALLAHICKTYASAIKEADAHLLDNLRKTRNDVEYYGQKNKETLESFYSRNQERTESIKNALFALCQKRISES